IAWTQTAIPSSPTTPTSGSEQRRPTGERRFFAGPIPTTTAFISSRSVGPLASRHDVRRGTILHLLPARPEGGVRQDLREHGEARRSQSVYDAYRRRPLRMPGRDTRRRVCRSEVVVVSPTARGGR